MPEALKETDILLHAYVLMTNCVHLLLAPKRAAEVPKLVILPGRPCAQYINSTCGRRGALWNSRYKSSLIQAETYLLRCVRYFELNPVRPGMIGDPAYCRWSRFRCNALGQNSSPSTPHPVHAALGRSGEARCAAYRQLFRHHLEEAAVDDLRLALNQRQPLGDRGSTRERGAWWASGGRRGLGDDLRPLGWERERADGRQRQLAL